MALWFSSKRTKPLILHIDDSETVLLVTKAMLEEMGLEVMGVTNAVEGIKIAEKEKPTLILLDTNMPGMDGHEACETLKRNPKTKEIPVIMVTGADGMKEVERALSAGADGYVIKPVQADRLKAKLAEKMTLPGAGA